MFDRFKVMRAAPRSCTLFICLWGWALNVFAQQVDYISDIQPLLEDRCYRCHGPEKRKGGLRLDMKAAVWQGGDSGDAAIVPGEADQSPLFRLVSSKDDQQRMPPANAREAPLTHGELEMLRRWIHAGADWPETGSSVILAEPGELKVTEEDRQHWAFRPLTDPMPPSPQEKLWQQTPVDAFILHAQEENQLAPSQPADARTLIRRLYLDLIGLPPSPEEMSDWTRRIDQSSTEVELLVESLLHSPHYGERWGRHWLDVARYADSNGMELDADRPNAYRYRDFVIRAMNDDLPFDEFVRWQLAGDEIAPGHLDAIAATGFLAAGVNTILPDKQMVEEKLRNRANELDDIVSTTGQAMLGLTLACCRCHDHKYDPVSSRDYYRLTRVFTSGDRAEVPLVSPEEAERHQQMVADWKKSYDEVVRERDQWLKNARKPVEDQLRRERIEGLSEGTEADVGAEPVAIGELWLRNLTLEKNGWGISQSQLNVVTLNTEEGRVKAPRCILAVSKTEDNKPVLMIYGKNEQPLLTLPLSKVQKNQTKPLDMSASDDGKVDLC